MGVFGLILLWLWNLVTVVQSILNYGTAYRLTKKGGDNGVALFGWMLLMGFASVVPGLGFYLWHKYREKAE